MRTVLEDSPSQSKQMKTVSRNGHTLAFLLLQNHDGVTVRTPSIRFTLFTSLEHFLAWIMTKRILLDLLDRTKKRRSGPNDLGGKQNVNRLLLVVIHSNTLLPSSVAKPMFGEEPDDSVQTEISGSFSFARPATVTSSNSSCCQARSGHLAKSSRKVNTWFSAGAVVNMCRR